MVVEAWKLGLAWKVSTVSLNDTTKELRERQPRLKTEKATFHTGYVQSGN